MMVRIYINIEKENCLKHEKQNGLGSLGVTWKIWFDSHRKMNNDLINTNTRIFYSAFIVLRI
jgi:hypothetical protein